MWDVFHRRTIYERDNTALIEAESSAKNVRGFKLCHGKIWRKDLRATLMTETAPPAACNQHTFAGENTRARAHTLWKGRVNIKKKPKHQSLTETDGSCAWCDSNHYRSLFDACCLLSILPDLHVSSLADERFSHCSQNHKQFTQSPPTSRPSFSVPFLECGHIEQLTTLTTFTKSLDGKKSFFFFK